jgi:phosphate starvation-inducible protein PhoH and related proteins
MDKKVQEHGKLDLTITLQPHAHRTALFGPNDRNLRILREMFGVQVVARDGAVKLCGNTEAVGKTASVIERMQELLLERDQLEVADVHEALTSLDLEIKDDEPVLEGEIVTENIEVFTRGVKITAKTPGQSEYIHAVMNNDLVFCLGPAGTGKTYLAVAVAVSALKRGVIKRIVLVRPAVEAGEKLGYLPGDLQAKVNPYLRPLLDAMHDMMGFDQIKRFMMNDLIEVIPLAYMRGRTLNNAAIIMDEAQNTTASQMLMFLTRLGHHSKMIVTGDDTQVDLERPDQSGLLDAVSKLQGVKGIGVVRLTGVDIVRHRLVQTIVEAYGSNSKTEGKKKK